jgi:hypothetical protein
MKTEFQLGCDKGDTQKEQRQKTPVFRFFLRDIDLNGALEKKKQAYNIGV